jgi:hypothetical protein
MYTNVNTLRDRAVADPFSACPTPFWYHRMMFRSVRSVGSSPLGSLSSQQALDLANLYLRNATQTTSDLGIFLVLCHDTKASLSQAKKAARTTRDQALSDGIATAYISLSQLLTSQGYTNEAQAIDKKAEKLW